jgi:hypothetical protein
MKLKNILTNILLLALCFLSLTCKSLTGPDDSAQPGSRNYLWTTDTLKYLWQPNMEGIWGSSPTDVWTGGEKDIFHYDGTTWTHWAYIPCELNTIYGFSANDVWIGGSNGKIWHFDGSQWTENFVYKPENAYLVDISDIYGSNPNDVYAVGVIFYSGTDNTNQRGFVLHNDGSGWKEVYKANYYSQYLRVRTEDGIANIEGTKISYTGAGDTSLMYQYNGNILQQIYSGNDNLYGHAEEDEIGGRVYFIFSHDVCRYVRTNEHSITGDDFSVGTFVKQFSLNDPKFDGQIYGRNSKDIFATAYDGIMHWNGADLVYLMKFSNDATYIPVPAIFEKDVFFGVQDLQNSVVVVVHGKLIGQ